MMDGNGLLWFFESEPFPFASGREFYTTCVEDNQKLPFFASSPQRSFTLTPLPE
jgi:hypothetical protein